MIKRVFWAVGALALLLLAGGSARAQTWTGYYPGGHVNWYFGPYWFIEDYPSPHWPSRLTWFTYGLENGTYKVYQPREDRLPSFFIQAPREGREFVETSVHVSVLVPSTDADVWFDGIRTQQIGLRREFRSLPLVLGRPHKYEVKAFWKDGDDEFMETRTIRVKAGDRVTVDFQQGADTLKPLPRPERTKK